MGINLLGVVGNAGQNKFNKIALDLSPGVIANPSYWPGKITLQNVIGSASGGYRQITSSGVAQSTWISVDYATPKLSTAAFSGVCSIYVPGYLEVVSAETSVVVNILGTHANNIFQATGGSGNIKLSVFLSGGSPYNAQITSVTVSGTLAGRAFSTNIVGPIPNLGQTFTISWTSSTTDLHVFLHNTNLGGTSTIVSTVSAGSGSTINSAATLFGDRNFFNGSIPAKLLSCVLYNFTTSATNIQNAIVPTNTQILPTNPIFATPLRKLRALTGDPLSIEVPLVGRSATFDYNNRLLRYPRTITFELQK